MRRESGSQSLLLPSPDPDAEANRKLPISAVVLTFNEERNIEACLASLVEWIGEIFVVDSGSTDATVAIARHYTDKVYFHSFDSYGEQRNWAQSTLSLSHEWVLHVDADERVTTELADSIHGFFASNESARCEGAMFSRRTIFLGRWIRHGGHYPVFHTRLFRRAAGRCEDRLYDQHFLVNGRVARLHGDLIDVLAPELDTWTVRHLRWAAAEASEQSRSSGRTGQLAGNWKSSPISRRRWLRNRVFGRLPLFLRAYLYFFYRYVLRLGFLDGTEGLIFHFLHACWFRFYTDAKIWEASRAEEKT